MSAEHPGLAAAHSESGGRTRCLVVHPRLSRGSVSQGRGDEARLGEAVNLAEAIGLSVAHAEVTPVPRTRPSTLLGRGAVERLAHVIADAADEGAIAVVIVDAMLSPVQQRNLEKAWQCKVIDRTGVILEIFGARARTAEGRLQVESAALTYQRSRLVRSWTHLERQRGGFGFLGGPGESQLETDRRIIGDRIVRIGRELATVKRTRGLHRQARRRVPFPVVALVGYTNAGKSTLFNELTGAAVLVRDQLFATLDPTMRRLRLPSGRTVILSDTVGFLSDLPHELIEAFHATLEEVMEADLIVLVRDAADPETDQQRKDVLDVLEALGLGERLTDSVVEVLNKIDRLTEDDLVPLINRAERSTPPVIPLSAKTGQGCDQLLAALDARLATASRVLDLSLSHADGASLAWLYDHGQVLCRKDDRDAVYLSVRLDAADAERFARRAAAGRH